MKTLTLKIDETTRYGKQFLSLVEFFTAEKKGVTILDQKSGIEEAIDDVEEGRINSYENSDELFDKILG